MNDITFNDYLDCNSINKLIDTIKNAISKKNNNTKDKTINLYINSNGGDINAAMHGYHMINKLLELNKDITINTINTSIVASAANLIYLIGKKRFVYNSSYFVIHAVRISNIELKNNDVDFFKAELKQLSNFEKSIFIQNKVKINNNMFKKETFINDKEAIKIGLAHKSLN